MAAHPAYRRQTTRGELMSMVERLTAEFAGKLPPGSVMRCVYRSREELLGAGVRDGIVRATESSARRRLMEVVGAHAAV
jgi:hypothetical protein